ncbi:MAG: uroporphyrinogen decarboxylase family protein [Phycisphaerae bacterium]|jgi:uroporphyrinogen decarboxylase|nr:uroporphyrinogen decarboxylase family protein [Phycisphaerae bacterium]
MGASIIQAGTRKLTHRERFQRVFHYQTVDRGIHWEFGYLGETVERWHSEGMPKNLVSIEGPGSIEDYFGVDPIVMLPVNLGLHPPFEGKAKILKVEGNRRVVQDPDGTVFEQNIDGTKTIPNYIKMPIADRDDWKRFKERLQSDTPGRCDADWRALGAELAKSDVPVVVWLGSYFGIPRNWIGFENIALMCYDDRDLVEEIVETLTELYLSQLSACLKEVRVDMAWGWEDICFRNGPIISPKMFSEIVGTRLKRVCDLLRQHGCDVIMTDCDGYIEPLVPVWLDAGLNCMFPIEVHSGTDPMKLREKFGKQILLRGGLEKYRLAKGKREIIDELKCVEKLVAEGGYVPHGDHRIPEDVSYDNYRYYIREKLAMLGWPADEAEAIEPLKGVKSEWS